MNLLNENGKRPEGFLSDLEINIGDIDLDELDKQLSEEDERILEEIAELTKKIDSHPNLIDDLLKAVRTGTENYIDAMTDTGDTFSDMKNPKNIRNVDNVEIDKKNKPLDRDTSVEWATRRMGEAKDSPFDKNVKESTLGMSPEGIARFERYKEAYSQRTKTISAVSKDGNTIKYKDDEDANYRSLSGIRSFRFGPMVDSNKMPNVQTMKEEFQKKRDDGKNISASGFIREKNYDAMDRTLMETFGFKTKSEAAAWRKSMHLTPHETPEGIFLVPTDVHDATSHKGYCSAVKDVLDGKEGAEQTLKNFKREETKKYIAYEAKVRGVRMAKGMGLNAIKDVLKFSVATLCTETIHEFKTEVEDKLIDRIKRIIKNFWDNAKTKIKKLFKTLGQTFAKSALTELLTALNDFLFGTFKNIFKIIRQMFSSIRNAIRVIFSKESSWKERIFEASKILAAGAVGVLGFSLNELIEKGLMSIGFPFASFIAECLSGLFAGILSAIVLMLFDHVKGSFEVKNAKLHLALLESKSIAIDVARIDISMLKVDRALADTFSFFATTIENVNNKRNAIVTSQIETIQTIERTKPQIKKMEENIEKLKSLKDDGAEF